jgi:hypothetical protein
MASGYKLQASGLKDNSAKARRRKGPQRIPPTSKTINQQSTINNRRSNFKAFF